MNILITGASRGLGASLAAIFAGSGSHSMILTSRNEKSLDRLKNSLRTENTGSEIHVIPADLNREPDLQELILRVKERVGQLDILVNNAGMLINKSFSEISRDQITAIFGVNYFAPAILIRELIPLLEKAGRAHVLNITSMGGFQGSVKFPGLSHYSASKAALAVLTECLAAEYRGKGIAFNCLAIGSVQTEMLAEAFPGYRAPLTADQMAEFVSDFALKGHAYFNGKILPVALTTP
jgi:3-oxoacyl-[acyl-carrier protein] reductase